VVNVSWWTAPSFYFLKKVSFIKPPVLKYWKTYLNNHFPLQSVLLFFAKLRITFSVVKKIFLNKKTDQGKRRSPDNPGDLPQMLFDR
jgi:hypothetical protein